MTFFAADNFSKTFGWWIWVFTWCEQ